MSLQLNEQQSKGITEAIKWFFNPDKDLVFTIGGYAGTGKSSTVNLLVELLGINKYQVLYVTLTGKASSLLRAKGAYSNTIHSTFYRVCVDNQTGQTFFAKRKSINSCIKLIVIDEVSMVDGKMMEDIKTFGIPILALGDPGQLPPLFTPNMYIQHPNVMLTMVMRQAGDSGILVLATMARNDEPIPNGKYIESQVLNYEDLLHIEIYDAVLCWSNRTRKKLNKEIRHRLGYDRSKYPLKGEKIVCIKNDLNHEIIFNDTIINPMNGMVMNVLEDPIIDTNLEYVELKVRPDFIDDKHLMFNLKCPKCIFDIYSLDDPNEAENINLFDLPREYTACTFAYAISVHKSQGSQWNNVVVVDDYHGRKDQYKNWLYSGITRAVESVTIARVTKKE